MSWGAADVTAMLKSTGTTCSLCKTSTGPSYNDRAIKLEKMPKIIQLNHPRTANISSLNHVLQNNIKMFLQHLQGR